MFHTLLNRNRSGPIHSLRLDINTKTHTQTKLNVTVKIIVVKDV